jgi:hypothetical protein
MAFTDGMLTRWKQMTPGSRVPPLSEVHELLARLEAAESLIGIEEGTTTFSKYYQEWRTAAGKTSDGEGK